MMMEMFANKFPEIAEKETRCILMPEGKDLPEGHYYFPESFCNDKECDCRRAFINVIFEEETIATIGFGWENLKFYENWANDKSIVEYIKGPILELTGIRTKYSENALSLFKGVLMQDKLFLGRLPIHYKMFKDSLSDSKEDEAAYESEDFNPDEHTVISLCRGIGTGFEAITDTNREAFYPIIMAIEEEIWSHYLENDSFKDSEVIELLKNLRDNILSEEVSFNMLEKEIIRKIKVVLFLNDYNQRDLSLSISSVLKSAKLHKSMGGNRGYLTFISHFFEQMKK